MGDGRRSSSHDSVAIASTLPIGQATWAPVAKSERGCSFYLLYGDGTLASSTGPLEDQNAGGTTAAGETGSRQART